MRAIRILQEKLGKTFWFLHAKQAGALWRGVAGLLNGHQLWLTALGRSLPGHTSDKHRIKAVDRLVGSSALQHAVPKLYAVLAAYLLRGIRRPVLLVDWTGAHPGFYVLSAKLSFQGRALSLFSRTFPAKRKCSPAAEREFLTELATIIPSDCTPIVVTDAGFHIEWFDAVRSYGWDFVGRLRNKITAQRGPTRKSIFELFALAGRRPRDLGTLRLRLHNAREYRLVLSAKRKLKGRKQLTVAGTPRQRTADHQRRRAARQPWLLATSMNDPARVVVQVYAMRMQIEQTFRDIKSHRYGWSVEDVRCKDPKRVDVLLLVGAFAAVAMHVVGLAAFGKNLQRGFQANTERRRTVFSTFFLGKLTTARGLDSSLPTPVLRAAATDFKRLLLAASLS